LVVQKIRSVRGPPVLQAIPADRNLPPNPGRVVPAMRNNRSDGGLCESPPMPVVRIAAAEGAGGGVGVRCQVRQRSKKNRIAKPQASSVDPLAVSRDFFFILPDYLTLEA
jgi:hypothetical protein